MKRVLAAFESLNQTGVSSNVTGEESNVEYLDIVFFDFTLTNGNSFDSEIGFEGAHNGKKEWFDLDLGITPVLTDAQPEVHYTLEKVPYVYIRPKLTVNAGDGDVKILISGKSYSN